MCLNNVREKKKGGDAIHSMLIDFFKTITVNIESVCINYDEIHLLTNFCTLLRLIL